MNLYDNDEYRIAKVKNVAENGRCFVALVFFLNLLTGHPLLALLAALTVAASIFVDMMPVNIGRRFALGVYAYMSVIVLASFVNLW